MITEVRIHNYKSFKDSALEFNSGMNILVGDNGSGKSTLLEAIALATTGRLHGKYLYSGFSSHLINLKAQQKYLQELHTGKIPPRLKCLLKYS